MPPIPKKPTESPVQLGEWSTTYTLLSCTLQLAVPLWIESLRGRGWEYVIERAKACSDEISEHGDLILFKGKKKGQSAEAFNRLAEGIACLSFCPGGVKIFGSHWEAILDESAPGLVSDVLQKLCAAIQKGLSAADS